MKLQTKYYQLWYENATVRWIKTGGVEIIRSIYSAVRDHNWGTVEPKILDEKVVRNETGFEVVVMAEYKQNNIHFQAEYKIKGEANQLVFEMKGEAKSTFRTNRVGFCVLHPIKECAGKSCRVIHPDQSTEKMHFPELISPVQPMRNIKKMVWSPTENIRAQLDFTGDVFEMEDQRNWSDASYKTYCRPLELPFPYEINRGETIQQKVLLNIQTTEHSGVREIEPVIFRIEKERTCRIPEYGVCSTSRKETLTGKEAKILKELPFSHLRAELKLFDGEWKLSFVRIIAESNRLGLPLFLVLYFSENWRKECLDLEEKNQKMPMNVKFILVVGKNHLSDDAIFSSVNARLKKNFPKAKIGTGVNAYFAELNRNQPKMEPAGFVSFAICPQVHAFDNATLVENLEAQKFVVDSAKTCFRGKPVYVSPVTLKQRFNVVATSGDEPPSNGKLPPQADARQNSVFAAQWLLGSLKFLSQSGADLVTFFETVGWRGFIQGEYEPPLPDQFSARKNEIFPVFAALKEISGYNEIVFSKSDSPLNVDGIVLQKEKETKVLLANFSEYEQQVAITGLENLRNARALFGSEIKIKNEIIYLSPGATVALVF